MQQYTVANETGLITSDEQTHAVGDVITLDETAQDTIDWQASGVIVLVVATDDTASPAAAPADTTDAAPVGPADSTASTDSVPVTSAAPAPFTLTVVFADGAATADMNAAQSFVADLSNEINGEADSIPAVITSLTITRSTPTDGQ